MSRYRFIAAHQACYPIALVCRVIYVGNRTPPGYFYFRPDDDPSMTSFVHRDELEPVPE